MIGALGVIPDDTGGCVGHGFAAQSHAVGKLRRSAFAHGGGIQTSGLRKSPHGGGIIPAGFGIGPHGGEILTVGRRCRAKATEFAPEAIPPPTAKEDCPLAMPPVRAVAAKPLASALTPKAMAFTPVAPSLFQLVPAGALLWSALTEK